MVRTVSIRHEMLSVSGGIAPGSAYFYHQIDASVCGQCRTLPAEVECRECAAESRRSVYRLLFTDIFFSAIGDERCRRVTSYYVETTDTVMIPCTLGCLQNSL